eukprot:NODE_8964_length_671_cov_63.206204_g8702_i0.p1 GENE.NODE_8964_length_671_cov_63.206204_g8702_i0~~NODE_8964_length_671_cov_63.206204_g8702_i0.p1  ORF type:complete len:175 (+),score=50.65 NODE_8964_length_671_cov_63.206204_g8702_i0:68-526(+)
MPEYVTGKICRWDDEKGFGFIKVDDGGPDVFLHASAVKCDSRHVTLEEGERVEFEIVDDDRSGKKRAANCTGPGGETLRCAPGGGPSRGRDRYDDRRRDDDRYDDRDRGRGRDRSRSRSRGRSNRDRSRSRSRRDRSRSRSRRDSRDRGRPY